FLNFGLAMEEVLPMVTRNPLAVVGWGDRLKGIAVGEPADLSIFRWEEGPVTYRDYYGHSLEGKGKLTCLHTIRKGKRQIELTENQFVG
ncbi:MAG: hypothetical protein QHH30_06910, partial [candidate division NC10 bacterium]|nr:hypothetical protein [candidate division NC10 bacterium]